MRNLLSRLFGAHKNMEKETYLIIGLGNPGAKYAHTRHNCGFEVIRLLSDALACPLTKNRLQGLLGETTVSGSRVVLCQPQTMMNLSGNCVGPLVSWYKVPMDHLLIIYDDIDLPLGTTRMRKGGSAGTHNGMRSILSALPSQDFPRIRIGVGAQPEGWDLADWVLSSYRTREETEAVHAAFEKAAACAQDWVASGIDHAMQLCNRK